MHDTTNIDHYRDDDNLSDYDPAECVFASGNTELEHAGCTSAFKHITDQLEDDTCHE